MGRISRHPTEPKRGCPSSPVSFSRTRHLARQVGGAVVPRFLRHPPCQRRRAWLRPCRRGRQVPAPASRREPSFHGCHRRGARRALPPVGTGPLAGDLPPRGRILPLGEVAQILLGSGRLRRRPAFVAQVTRLRPRGLCSSSHRHQSRTCFTWTPGWPGWRTWWATPTVTRSQCSPAPRPVAPGRRGGRRGVALSAPA